MRCNDFELGVLVKKAFKNHARDGQRGVKHETHRPAQIEFGHVHHVHARRIGGVHQHGQAALVDLGPNRRKHGIGQAFARNIGQDHHTACAVAAGSV